MGSIQPLVMPKLGLTMTEGALVEWRVGPGDAFSVGDILFVVETDKIANEIEAEASGRMVEILVPAGESKDVGAIVARVDYEGKEAVSASKPAEPDPKRAEPRQPPPPSPSPRAADPVNSPGQQRIRATPLARRLAKEKGVDLSTLTGSGPRGRIKAIDIEQARPAHDGSADVTARASAPAMAFTEVELGRNQLVAARRTARAKAEIPHFYLTANVTLDALSALRAEVNASGAWPKTTMTHWMVAAIGRALSELPQARRVMRDDRVVEFAESAVGVVADLDGELFIPVVGAADTRSVGQIAAAMGALVERARNRSLRQQDIAGAAVSLSNLGMYGIDSLTPVIDVEQGMILGVGRTTQVLRPGPDGSPIARGEATLTLACDHRIHNGVFAARFLGCVAAFLEAPMRLLLEPLATQEAHPTC
jgi:pyruvate dehydrogenase E2 component (dihydrolipoamide acetyltransferase)